MKIYHHTDNDGYCAAAIAKNYLVNAFDIPTEYDFIPYTYGMELPIKEVNEGETVYILDLALDEKIFKLIKYCVESKAKVVHIDHHVSSNEFINKMNDSDKKILDQIKTFYVNELSATMLTFAYDCFNDDEKADVYGTDFYLTEDMSVLQVGNGDDARPYHVPLIIRYVNDYDLFTFELPETEAFEAGFRSYKHREEPWHKDWSKLFQAERALIPTIIEDGRIVIENDKKRYESIMKHAFVVDHVGDKEITCLCVNTDSGTSKVFGDKINDFPMACMYYYDGSINKWKYAFRSHDNGENVSAIAVSFGGGGHVHAAGCELPTNIFTDDVILKGYEI